MGLPRTVRPCDVEVGNVNDPHQEKPRETQKGWKSCRHSRTEEEEIRVNLLLVEKRLNQLGPGRDVRFGRGQEGAWRQRIQLKDGVTLTKADGAGACYPDSWSWR